MNLPQGTNDYPPRTEVENFFMTLKPNIQFQKNFIHFLENDDEEKGNNYLFLKIYSRN